MLLKRPYTRQQGISSKMDRSGSSEKPKPQTLLDETYSENSSNSDDDERTNRPENGFKKSQVNAYVRKQEGANVAGTSEKNEPQKRKRNAKKTFVYTPEFLANLPYGVKYAPQTNRGEVGNAKINEENEGNDWVQIGNFLINIEQISKQQLISMRRYLPSEEYRLFKNRKSARICRLKRKRERGKLFNDVGQL